jgi:hypothetical protein
VKAADPLAAPGLARFADLTVQVAAPIEVGAVGHGMRRNCRRSAAVASRVTGRRECWAAVRIFN